MRACEETEINDCKVANGVKYCFCITDLCNDSPVSVNTPTDDEDLLEGSGFRVIPSNEEITTPKVPETTTSRGFQVDQNLLFFILVPSVTRFAT